MKKSIFTLSLLLTAFFMTSVIAQDTAPQIAGAEITFEKDIHDYGQIQQHGNGECEFKFTNTGSAPLLISNSVGSCGCTVPVWPKEPIAPGASGVLKVKYDTKRIGLINKSVTVTSNSTNSPNTVLRIKGEVLAPVAEPVAPE